METLIVATLLVLTHINVRVDSQGMDSHALIKTNVLMDQMIATQTPAVATPSVLTHVNVTAASQEMDSHAQL